MANMPVIHLADKYSSKIVERFYKDSFIMGKVSQEYSWDGVKSINVYSFNTVDPVNYNRPASGATLEEGHNTVFNRYGVPQEIGDSVQTMTITQDKAVSMVFDKADNVQSLMLRNAGKMLNREIREKFTPMIDKYAIEKFSTFANSKHNPTAGLTTKTVHDTLSKETIVDAVSSHVTALINNLTDPSDAYCLLKASDYAKLVLSAEFIAIEKLGEKSVTKGEVGSVRGLRIVQIPDSYFPTGVNFLTFKKSCVLLPIQIKETKIHTSVPGLSGALMEARYLYDAFCLDERAGGVIVDKTA